MSEAEKYREYLNSKSRSNDPFKRNPLPVLPEIKQKDDEKTEPKTKPKDASKTTSKVEPIRDPGKLEIQITILRPKESPEYLRVIEYDKKYIIRRALRQGGMHI